MVHDRPTDNGAARRRRWPVAVSAALGGCTLAAVSAVPATAHDADRHSHDTRYVSLGDSYTSGPLIPTQVDANCLRSDQNYPSLVAAQRKVSELKDVSCSGATTAEMWKAQGTNDAQLDAVTKDTDLVTLQIGGNDIGFSSIIATCAQLGATDPTGDPCKTHYKSAGYDELALKVVQTAPKVDRILRAVHAKAPHARVLVVGYPDQAPDDGSGCFSASAPFAAKDFPYLRDTEKKLNLMLKLVAGWNHAEYVDTYTPSIGHDMCKSASERWIEPLKPSSPAAPVHPNAKGEQAMADAVLQRLDKRG